MGGPARPSAPRAVLDLPGTPDLQTRPTAPSTEPFFVTGFAPQKKLPKGVTVQKNTANHLAQGLQRIPTIHSQSTHNLSTGARLAKPPIPHYLVSRSQRTTRYRGSCKITHKSQPARSSDFPGGTSGDFSSQTAPAEATEASPSRALFGHGCCRPALASISNRFWAPPKTFDFGQGAASHCP